LDAQWNGKHLQYADRNGLYSPDSWHCPQIGHAKIAIRQSGTFFHRVGYKSAGLVDVQNEGSGSGFLPHNREFSARSRAFPTGWTGRYETRRAY